MERLQRYAMRMLHDPANMLRYDNDTETSGLSNDAFCDPFQAQSTQSCLAMFDLRNFVDVFEADSSDRALRRITCRGAVCACLALLAFMVVHWARYIACTANLVLGGQDTGGTEQERSGWRGP
jgi:hypothetical protein